MPEPYGPKPPEGQLTRALKGLTPAQKSAYLATRLAKLKSGSYSYTLDGVNFTLSNWRAMRQPGPGEQGQATDYGFVRDDDAGLFLEVTVAANDANGALPLPPEANPFLFTLNPALILVWNGTWREEDGVDVPNLVEDPIGGVQRMVAETVKAVARSNGWDG